MSKFFKRTIAFTVVQMNRLQEHLDRLGLDSVSELVRRIIDDWLERNQKWLDKDDE